MSNLTCARSDSQKESKEGAQQEQVPGQVQRAQGAATELPVDCDCLWLSARVHGPDKTTGFGACQTLSFGFIGRACASRRSVSILYLH